MKIVYYAGAFGILFSIVLNVFVAHWTKLKELLNRERNSRDTSHEDNY